MSRKFELVPDGSVVDSDGKVIHFSSERFIRDVCEGKCCFICGRHPSTIDFNNEHVFPDWLLRRFSLHDENVKLGNGTSFKYSRYVIPCCVDCNSLMGHKIETPISKILTGKFHDLEDYINHNGYHLIYIWLGLLFFKIHLCNRSFRMDRDLRVQSKQIADHYQWKTFHFLHSVIRSFYGGAETGEGVTGSFVYKECHTKDVELLFDHCAFYLTQSIFIRLGGVALYAVFTDAAVAVRYLNNKLNLIDGPLNELQVWELFAELSDANYRLINRPKFSYSLNTAVGDYKISCRHKKFFRLGPQDFRFRGLIISSALEGKSFMDDENIPPKASELLEQMKQGRVTFLFDDTGAFYRGPSVIFNRRLSSKGLKGNIKR